MPDQKLDNLLNLAMDATPQEREKSENLTVGYDSSAKVWECDCEVQWAGEWTWRRGDSGDTASGGICSGDIVRVGNRCIFQTGTD